MRFVDPCADVAILGDSNWQCDLYDMPDGQNLEESLAALLGRTLSLKVQTKLPERDQPFTTHVFTKDGEWVTETATLTKLFSPQLHMSGDGRILPGTSGSPVFNDDGQVVGIVSASSSGDEVDHCVVLLVSALPGWALLELEETNARSKGLAERGRLREFMKQSGATIEQLAAQLHTDVESLRLLLEDDD